MSSKKTNFKLFIFLTVGILLSAMAAVRIFGEDMDFFSYETYYDSIENFSSSSYEPVFNFIAVLIRSKGFEFSSFLFLVAFISLSIKFFVFNKFKYPIYSVLIYIFIFYPLHEMTQIRVAIGTAIVFLSFYFRGMNYKSYSFILMILALGTHYSMIIFVPFLFLFERLKEKSYIILVYLFLFPFILKIFFLPYAELIGNVQDHVLNLHDYAPQNILSTRSILSVILILYFFYNFNSIDLNYRAWLYIWFFGYSCFIAFHSFPIISGRIFELAFISIVVVPANFFSKNVYKILIPIGMISLYVFIKMLYIDPIFIR